MQTPIEEQLKSTVPPLMCDPQLTLELAEYMSQIGIEELKGIPNSTATEDFAIIAEKNTNNLYAFNSWIYG